MTDSGQSSGSANPRSPGGNRLRWQTQVDAGEPENLLPRNVEAERGVLGTMLLRPGDVIPRVATVLKSSDLFLRAHRIIFSAILKIHQAGETVTIMSLTSELRGRKALEEVGGLHMLPNCSTKSPSTTLMGSRRLLNESRKRRLLARQSRCWSQIKLDSCVALKIHT